ncbi:MAG: methylenetetrahydrofolate reductase [Pseudolabrys sp.]
MQSALRPSRFIRSDRLSVSFEFFPPKDEAMEKILWESIERLAPLNPNFVSVTYGAGGSTRERTHNTVKRILKETTLTPAAHLTCVAASRAEIEEIVRGYHAAGVRHIVALRGDSVEGPGTRYAPHPDGRAITQFFFDNELYFRYLDRVRARGIDIPIVPGILPVQNFKSAKNFATRAGASVPAWLAERFEGLESDSATRKLIAAAVAAEQVIDLLDSGITTFHFYTMNRADLVYAICHLLGLRPAPKAKEEAA